MAEEKGLLWIVEDDESIALCLKMILEDHGYRVAVAHTLQAARRLEGRPALVLLDFLLPDGNGVAFLPELEQRFAGTQVILLTALDRVGSSRFPNHVEYLPKPFHNRELLTMIERKLHGTESMSA